MSVSIAREWNFARVAKSVSEDTNWKRGAVPPRHAPVYTKSKNVAPSWSWRSLKLEASDGEAFICYFEVSPSYDKWKAWLLKRSDDAAWSVVLRLEDQPRQSGLHVHANCGLPLETGGHSINMLHRVPEHGQFHRRRSAWTIPSFFNKACSFFGIELDTVQPDMFDDA